MRKTGRKTFLILVGWAAVLSVVYWGLSETSAAPFIAALYALAGTILFIFFLLVNGGFRPLQGEEEKRAFAQHQGELQPRKDLFRLGAEKQEKAARLLLTLAIPFFFILLADWVYLHFFFKD